MLGYIHIETRRKTECRLHWMRPSSSVAAPVAPSVSNSFQLRDDQIVHLKGIYRREREREKTLFFFSIFFFLNSFFFLFLLFVCFVMFPLCIDVYPVVMRLCKPRLSFESESSLHPSIPFDENQWNLYNESLSDELGIILIGDSSGYEF